MGDCARWHSLPNIVSVLRSTAARLDTKIAGPRRGRPHPRRAITDSPPKTTPAASSEPAHLPLPHFGPAEFQLVRGYALTIAIVIVFTVLVPMIMTMVRNF